MSEYLRLPYGQRADGRLVSVADAPRGKACDLVCPQCRGPLIARKGGLLRHHFAHAAEGSCAGALETMLHLLGKQIVADSCSVMLPEVVATLGNWRKPLHSAAMFEADAAEREARLGSIRPDVLLSAGGRRLAVEILVSHPCGLEKLAAFRAAGLDAIEIDLSRFRRDEIGPDIGAVVRRSAPRAWLWNAEAKAEQRRMDEWQRRKREDEAREAERHRVQAAHDREMLRRKLEAPPPQWVAASKAAAEAREIERQRRLALEQRQIEAEAAEVRRAAAQEAEMVAAEAEAAKRAAAWKQAFQMDSRERMAELRRIQIAEWSDAAMAELERTNPKAAYLARLAAWYAAKDETPAPRMESQ